jgi:gliding motility-associated-like protein
MKSFLFKLALLCTFVNTAAFVFGQNFQREIKPNPNTITNSMELGEMTVLPNGNIISAGISFSRALYPLFICMSPTGNIVWSRGIRSDNGGGGPAYSVTRMIPLDNGNFIAIMVDLNTVILPQGQISKESCIAEISGTNGTLVWARTYGKANTTPISWFDIVPVNDGYIVSGNQNADFTIAKIDLTGQLLWQRSFKIPGTISINSFQNIAIDPDGHIYATSSITLTIGAGSNTQEMFVSKMDKDGNILWWRTISSPQRTFFTAELAFTSDKEPVIWGTTAAAGPVDYIPFLLELSPSDGAIVQHKKMITNNRTFRAVDLHRIEDRTFLLTIAENNSGSLAHYAKFNLDTGIEWSFYDNKTIGTGNVFRSSLGTDQQVHCLNARLSLSPLERTFIITKTDIVAFNKTDCCHLDFPLQFNDGMFNETSANFTTINPQCPVSTFNPTFENYAVQSSNACPNPSVLSINADTTNYCTGACVPLSTNPASGLIRWETAGQTPVVSDTGAVFCFNTPGTYQITAVSVANECQRAVRTLTIQDIPADTIQQLDTLTCPGACIQFALKTIRPNVQYQWTFDNGVPNQFLGPEPPPVCYEQAGNFSINVQIVGCAAQASRNLEINYEPFEIPNVFTPNNDGLNDVFKPVFRCPNTRFRLNIFNRWGEKIFETENPEAGWDGRRQNKLAPMDVYVWQMEITDLQNTGTTTTKSTGEVTLIR